MTSGQDPAPRQGGGARNTAELRSTQFGQPDLIEKLKLFCRACRRDAHSPLDKFGQAGKRAFRDIDRQRFAIIGVREAASEIGKQARQRGTVGLREPQREGLFPELSVCANATLLMAQPL
jgi:hypothetical protein